MEETIIQYSHEGLIFHGFLVYDPKILTKRPAILVAHAWRGQDDFARDKARELASLGYIAFATDVYGKGTHVTTNDEAQALMLPLFIHRKTLRGRMGAAFEALIHHPLVDSQRIGAIGFCFGGLTVIELLRSGAPLRGVISFHGLLGNILGDHHAEKLPISSKAKGAILILHGHDDPFVSMEDIETIQNEFTKAQIDWQMHIYGHTAHAFTNPEAHDADHGMIFNAKANARAWQSLRNFFEDIFK